MLNESLVISGSQLPTTFLWILAQFYPWGERIHFFWTCLPPATSPGFSEASCVVSDGVWLSLPLQGSRFLLLLCSPGTQELASLTLTLILIIHISNEAQEMLIEWMNKWMNKGCFFFENSDFKKSLSPVRTQFFHKEEGYLELCYYSLLPLFRIYLMF